ncbi:MAG: hypothetical protein NTY47_05170 [Candidatus Omnitrophica bacterium]|nr:hypothetical protein [Candidatus Omnitrophota bacterium]
MRKYRAMLLALVFLCFLSVGMAMATDKPNAGENNRYQESVVKPPKELKTISLEEATNKVISIVNKYFVPKNDATLSGNSVEESGLYKVSLNSNNNRQYFYLTKDGALLIFPSGFIDIAKFEETAEKQKAMQKEKIPKTPRPTVELFVMSLCPYGIKAEKEILPVIKSFGDRVDFKIKFIVNVKSSTINEVFSMHGNSESREDARQSAIMKYHPDKFQSYIEKIDKNSCVISCGAVNLEDYWKRAAHELGMDVKKIESFAYGREGINLLKQNETDARKYEVSASPTLIINGIKSQAIYQGPKAVEQAIYSAFTNPPKMRQENK